jgi:hypothetical protein
VRTYLTIKNYRCFARPVRVEITKGFTAFVGVNNAGKSTIMRFLLELRPLITSLAETNVIRGLLAGQRAATNFLHVLDNIEVFSNLNQNPIEFSINLAYEPEDLTPAEQREEVYQFVISRDMGASATLFVDGEDFRKQPNSVLEAGQITRDGRPFVRFNALATLLYSLSNTLYIGPFRNTINAGGKTDYLDIQIGQSFIAQFRELKTGSSKKANTDISRLFPVRKSGYFIYIG